MIESLMNQSKEALDHFFEQVDKKGLDLLVKECTKSSGMIILTGVGKSGLVAEKIAMTMVSTGTKALFVPPGNFLHGDLGIVTQNDIILMFSKSGESEELLDIVPFVKKRGAKIVAVVSKKESRLAKEANQVVYLPVLCELGPLDLIPTVSTMVQLIFGDVLTIGIMQENKFPLSAYAENHPEGAIGKKLLLKVSDLMISGSQLPIASKDDRIADILVSLSEKKCGCLLIVDEVNKLLGIFTDGDLRRSLQRFGSAVFEKNLQELMTGSARTVSPEMLVFEAKVAMQEDPKKWIMILPVVKEGQVVGLIKMHDIIHSGL